MIYRLFSHKISFLSITFSAICLAILNPCPDPGSGLWSGSDSKLNQIVQTPPPPQLSTHNISSKSVNKLTSSDILLKFKNPVWIRFLDPDYDPDPAQNVINPSSSLRLPTVRPIKFHQNLSITSSDIPLKFKNPCEFGSRIRTLIRIRIRLNT